MNFIDLMLTFTEIYDPKTKFKIEIKTLNTSNITQWLATHEAICAKFSISMTELNEMLYFKPFKDKFEMFQSAIFATFLEYALHPESKISHSTITYVAQNINDRWKTMIVVTEEQKQLPLFERIADTFIANDANYAPVPYTPPTPTQGNLFDNFDNIKNITPPKS